MGTYIPSGPRSRSLYDTLTEAEDDHHLDCPTADFWLRAGALLLDCILFFLLHQGMLHIAATIVNYTMQAPNDPFDAERTRRTVEFGIWLARLLLFYFYFCWPVSRFGGTPAKMLLGLRVLDNRTGQRLAGPRAFLREAISKPLGIAVAGIGILMPLFRPDQRAMHDLIAGSVVKKVRGNF